MLLPYLIRSDANFYSRYAVPLIATSPRQFDLDGFHACLTEETSNAPFPSFNDFESAFRQFTKDTAAQYEMHPKFGRYAIDHMWNWVPINDNHGQHQQQQHQQQQPDPVPGGLTIQQHPQRPFQHTTILPWLDHITQRYHIHPVHRQLLERICDQLLRLNQTNRPLALVGSGNLNTLPFFPPTWFVDKQIQRSGGEGMSASFIARFVPPYRLSDVPERWDLVFLKGLTVMDIARQATLDMAIITAAVYVYGLTLLYDEQTGYSHVALVMKKATYGNLENSIYNEIPHNYLKPKQLALSITKRIKDLHWEYVHGNVHPRNILLNFADYVGDLVDLTFMQQSNDTHKKVGWNNGGRWPYMAPERKEQVSTAADIYGLGIILWQLIARVTFPEDALVDPRVYRIEPIPGVLKEWEDLVKDCLQPDPSKRPNAYTVYRRLEKIPENAPFDPTTINYIHVRRQEIEAYLATHRLQRGDPLTASVGNEIWSASVTRLANEGLDRYPNLVHYS
ncbi:kinase-like domain-containing protein [Dichotomocladium elegans]|nr:kinase-like domain-containing protein [Dichotomocladium elegans]